VSYSPPIHGARGPAYGPRSAAVRQTIERLANTSHFRGETVSSDAQ
jgi:hypothetical protein